MIRVFHKYRKSVVVILVAMAVCIMMTGFGVNILRNFNKSGGRNEYAIKVGETLISHQDFYDQKRAVQDNYRRMLGEMYPKFEENLTARLNEELSDHMVADTLLYNLAARNEMYVGENQVGDTIAREVFQGNFNPEAYAAFLRQSGTTARSFESKVEHETLKKQLVSFMTDISAASTREARAAYESEETTYKVRYVEISPQSLLGGIPDPSDQVLKALYDEKAADLELPARVSYDYIAFLPSDFVQSVNVAPEDIELAYTDNQDKYMNPEEIRARHIQFTFPPKADQNKKDELKTRAVGVLAKLQNGEAFEPLAQQNSDDFATATMGGDLGFVKRGVRTKEFDQAAFKLKDGGLSGLIETSYGYEIIRVEGYNPPAPKALDSVRAEIESEIRTREAPAYASARAQELFEEWQKSPLTLTEFAKAKNLKLNSSADLMQSETDPAPDLKGLTREILNFPEEKKQLVELNDLSVIAALKDYKEAAPPAFAEARPKLLDIYKQAEAKKMASQQTAQMLKDLKEKKYPDLDGAAKAAKLEVQETKDFKRSLRPPGPLADDTVRNYVLGMTQPLLLPERSFEVGDKYYLLQVNEVKRPDPAGFIAKQDQFRKQASEQLAQNLNDSLVEKLKAQTEIDVDPSIMARE